MLLWTHSDHASRFEACEGSYYHRTEDKQWIFELGSQASFTEAILNQFVVKWDVQGYHRMKLLKTGWTRKKVTDSVNRLFWILQNTWNLINLNVSKFKAESHVQIQNY
jgi:hypothetical protein